MKENEYASLAGKITIFIGLFATVSGSGVSVCLPQIKAAFQGIAYSDFLVKSMFVVSPLFGGLSLFFIGPLLDKWGRKAVITCSLLLSAAGIIGFFVNSLYLILASRILVGIGLGGTLIGFTALIGDYFKGSRLDKFMGLRSVSILLGNVFFLTLGGILADIDWRLVFLIHGISFFVAIGVWMFVDEPKAVKASDISKAKEPLPKSLNLVFLLAFLAGLPNCMVFVYAPFHLKSMAEVNATKISLALAGALVSGAFAALGYRKLRVYLSFQKILTICFLFLSAGFFIIAASGTYYGAFSGLILVGLAFGLFTPTLNILTVSRASSFNRGRALGILNVCLSSGPFFGIIVFQIMERLTSISQMFGATGILGLMAIVLLYIASSSKRSLSL